MMSADPDLQFHRVITPQVTVLQVTGEDAAGFLQSQFSNDLRRVAANAAVYGLWLDRKGKVCADSFVLQLGAESFLLISYECSPSTIKNKLEHFIVADDVEIEDISSEYRSLIVWGGGGDTRLGPSAVAVPDAMSWTRNGDALLISGRRSNTPHADVFFPASNEQLPAEWQSSLRSSGAKEVDFSAVEYERLRSGYPSVPRDVSPGELPHEGSLAEVAVSYTKGCYLGQEIMAHLKRSGGYRRKLFRVLLESPPPSERAPIYAGNMRIGEMRSSVIQGVNGIGFALLKQRELAGREHFSFSPGGEDSISIC